MKAIEGVILHRKGGHISLAAASYTNTVTVCTSCQPLHPSIICHQNTPDHLSFSLGAGNLSAQRHMQLLQLLQAGPSLCHHLPHLLLHTL